MDTANENEVNNIEHWWLRLQEEEFLDAFRITRKSVTDLQAEIDYMEKVNNDRIESPLLACLWYLGSVRPLKEANELFKMEHAETVIHDYLTKILNLGAMYILWPNTEEAHLMEEGFTALYRFPNVIGVIGSVYIEVNAKKSLNRAIYFNKRMKKHSIVLQVVCDHNLLLRNVCAGCPGGQSIQSILKSSPLYNILTKKDNELERNNHHLLGGTEHPQLNTLLTPYKLDIDTKLTKSQYHFNMMHSTVMSSVEHTFRCMENRFPRLTSVDDLNPSFATLVVSSICILHNFSRIRNDHCDLFA